MTFPAGFEYVCMMLLTAMMVAVVVLIHYEGLAYLNQKMARSSQRKHRSVMLYCIFMVIFLHLLEVFAFGLAYWLLADWPLLGYLHGAHRQNLFDDVYFSIITYSSLGYGDVVAVGALRFMVGVEGLVGLVMIGWSASFTYLEMQRYWPTRDG